MKRREAVGPSARAVLLPYRFLVFLAPIVAEGGFTLLAHPAAQDAQPAAPLEQLTVPVAKSFLRANSSANSTTNSSEPEVFSDDSVLSDESSLAEGEVVSDDDDDIAEEEEPDNLSDEKYSIAPSSDFISNSSVLADFDYPEGLPAGQLEATEAAAAERIQAENIADDLEKTVINMAKGGGQAIPKGFIKQITDMVDKVLKPNVLKHHKEDLILLKHLMDDYAQCDKSKLSESSKAGEAKRYRDLRSIKHRQCRADEAKVAVESSDCKKTLDLTTAVKNNVCGAIDGARVGPADQQATCIDRFCHYLPGENYEMYLRRIAAYFNKKLEEFEKRKAACEQMKAQVDTESKQCDVKEKTHAAKHEQCDSVQENLERASCVSTQQDATACDQYAMCYKRADAAFAKLKPILKRREDDRKKEWEALKRIECLLGALEDSKVTDAEMDTCKNKKADVTHLDISFKAVPTKAKCQGSKDGKLSGPTVPCSDAYVKAEYGKLPKRAPPKTCTPCYGPPPKKTGVPAKCKYISCQWTLKHSCPGQRLGTKGPATTKDGGLDGYECCCKYELWKNMKTKRKRKPSQGIPIVTVAKGGGSTPLGKKFWAKECVKIPANANAIKVVMGDITDYFKPADHNSYCDMLSSKSKHLWSPDGVRWVRPSYFQGLYKLGGSATNWPKLRVSDDYRQHLSFWGDEFHKGGCCSTKKTEPFKGWGQAFTMYYMPKAGTFVNAKKSTPAKKPLYGLKVKYPAAKAPSTTVAPVVKAAVIPSGCHHVMTSDPYGGPYDEAYWRQWCQKVPSEAKSIRIKMGEWTDYFKPLEKHSMCDMLASHNMHLWSPDGVSWVSPAFYPSGSFLGGSQLEWPASQGINPTRRYVSFWGHSWQRGGCCTSKKDHPYEGWSQAFTMEYCV